MDARENEDKQKVSWTHALRQIVINCYKYHGREDLLPVFSEDEAAAAAVAAAQGGNPGSNPVMGSVGVNPAGHHQQVSNDATEKKQSIIHNVVSNNATNTSVVRKIYTTGKSLSEALIFATTNPQYDHRFFIELQVQYMKIPSSEHGENMLCTQIVFCFCFDIQNNLCTQHVLPMFCKNKRF